MIKHTYRRNVTTIRASAGDVFVLELEGNPSTGYQWQVDPPPNLRLIDRDVNPGKGIGSSATERLTFEAVKPGDCVLHLEYKRVWEKGALEAHDIHVRVE